MAAGSVDMFMLVGDICAPGGLAWQRVSATRGRKDHRVQTTAFEEIGPASKETADLHALPLHDSIQLT